MERFNFRIPMFTDKGTFTEFQYIELGDIIEGTLCGYNGTPQQSTGLKDINGKLIYEGDLIKTKKHNLSEEDKIYEVFYSDTYSQFLARNGYCLDLTDAYKPEVIGNIYQNEDIYKEVLKGED